MLNKSFKFKAFNRYNRSNRRLVYNLPLRSITIGSNVNKDPYFLLGVSKDTPLSEIKKAYFHLAKKYHPDLNPDDEKAQETFLKI